MSEPDDTLSAEEAESLLKMMAGKASASSGIPIFRATAVGDGSSSQIPSALWETQRRYRALIEQIPVVTFMAAMDETIHELYVSPQIQTLLGFTQQEWLEDPFLWYNQLHPDDREQWRQEFARTCLTGVQFQSEYRFIARDGRVVWVHGECQIIRDENGQPLFLQGVAYDITESKLAQESLRQMQRNLEVLVRQRTAELAKANESLLAEIADRRQTQEALARQVIERGRIEEELRQRAMELADSSRRKDEFLAILAHELRNPLSPLTTASTMLRKAELPQSERRWAQSVIERQIATLTHLVDDLVDVSRISRGKINLKTEPMDLTAAINRALDATWPLLEHNGHQITVSLPEAPIPLVGDPIRLEQVMVNLLTNAIKYTPHGGHIWVCALTEEDQAVIRVRDSGIGIPPEMLDRIFELFTRVDSSPGRQSQWGMGVGLALVRGFVELHGGSITAASPGNGGGSEFIVRLPLQKTAAGAQPPTIDAPPAQRPRKVLIAEDHEDSAEGMARMLKSWRHDVRVVDNGPAALRAALEFGPDVLLLDIGLPGMDGYEVARELRKQPFFDKLQIFALSGYGREEDRQRAFDAGFDSHLTKPVNPDALRDLLAR